MKKILFTLLFLMAFFAGFSQMNNNGGTITVETGATLVIEGNYTSTSSGAIEIDGAVQLKGNFINTSGTISAGSTGRLTFNGTGVSGQEITGAQSTTFHCAVEVNNANGVALTTTSTGASQVLDSTLILTNGKVTLNAFDLTLSSYKTTGASASSYVVTNSTGQLKAPVTSVDYLLPVGTSTFYSPITLNNAGSADTYGVIFTGAMPGGWTGTDHAVTGHWTVTEGAAGGSNLTATPQWNGTQEQASFARTDCAVGVSTDNGATVAWKASGAAGGTNPYYKSGAGFTGIGQFLVGDYFYEGIELTADVILGGAYNGTEMSTALRAAGLIPLTDPYGNGVTVGSIPANVTDWVELQLRDKTVPSTIVKRYSMFVDKNGNILNPDGNVAAKLKGVLKDQYYLAVRHRNHLGAMTLNTINLVTGSASFDFTNTSSVTFGTNAQYNDGVKTMLWGGDANHDGTVQYNTAFSDIDPITSAVYSDPGNVNYYSYWVVSNVYDYADTDLSSTIEYNTATSDLDKITMAVYSHPGNINYYSYYVISQQLP